MRLLTSLDKLEHLDALKEVSNSIMLYTKFSSYYENYLSVEDIEYVLKNTGRKEVYALVNQIVFDKDLEGIKEFINHFKDTRLNYIFADLGVYVILEELGISKKGVYNPNTLIANYHDLSFWRNYPIKGIVPTLEIPLKDVSIMAKNKSCKIYVKAFGYNPMFQSRRQLLSAYKAHKNLDYNELDHDFSLVEEIRTEKYIINQNEKQSTIFAPGIHNILEAIDMISEDVDYAILDSLFIDYNDFLEVVRIYNDALVDLEHLNYYNDKIKKLIPNVQTAFMYSDSIFKKEDF